MNRFPFLTSKRLSVFSLPLLTIALMAAFMLGSLAGCKTEKPKTATGNGEDQVDTVEKDLPKVVSPEDQRVLDLIETEDLVLDCSIVLGGFAKWFESMSDGTAVDKSFPFPDLSECSKLSSADIETMFETVKGKPEFATVAHWPVTSTSKDTGNPWGALLDWNKGPWKTVKFGVVSAKFDGPDKKSFTMHTKAEGRIELEDKSTAQYGFKSHQDVIWTEMGGSWELTKWVQTDFTIKKSPLALFEDVLVDALGKNSRSHKNAIRSYKDEILAKLTKTGKFAVPASKHKPYIKASSEYLFPGVSIVDYDNDGDEDVFITARWGPTQMLRNDGDGKFTEVTNECGLFFKYLVNCSLFVDLDNDGDKDVLIGRPLEPVVYMENEGGVFKDVTKEKSNLRRLPFASGFSVSDVNGDGLLDVYISTYAPLTSHKQGWGSAYMEFQELKLLNDHHEGSNIRLNLAGTANVMLMNRGNGQLERLPYDEMFSQWRRSYQSVWADIDNDGDQDLYICNDFAPDALLRNDTPRGNADPVFTDVTKEVVLNKGIGFGMGASFADFDHDGDFDLYVSNMFSKAGRRIIKHLDKVDDRVIAASSGNFLYVNEDGKFTQKAGEAEDDFHVNQVGWSFGGQWVDFDNNGALDLYVPSGFFSAPKEASADYDT